MTHARFGREGLGAEHFRDEHPFEGALHDLDTFDLGGAHREEVGDLGRVEAGEVYVIAEPVG